MSIEKLVDFNPGQITDVADDGLTLISNFCGANAARLLQFWSVWKVTFAVSSLANLGWDCINPLWLSKPGKEACEWHLKYQMHRWYAKICLSAYYCIITMPTSYWPGTWASPPQKKGIFLRENPICQGTPVHPIHHLGGAANELVPQPFRWMNP